MASSQTSSPHGEAVRSKFEQHLVRWGFVVAVLILAFSGWQSYQSTMQFAQAAERQKHTDDVLGALASTIARLVDAETGQRGYLLTGNEAYLEPYRKAVRNLGKDVRALKSLTSDNASQQQRIQEMQPLISGKLSELQRTIELRRKGQIEKARQTVLQGTGKQLMDQIRTLAAQMAAEERNLLQERTERANRRMAKSESAIIAGTVVSIALLTLCFVLLGRELAERKRAQEALGKSEKWFATTLASIGDAVIATDMNGTVTFMNSVAESLTGWDLQEARGKSMDLVFDIVNRDTRLPVENPVKKVFREGKVVGLADHTLLLCKDGNEFDIEDSAAPILTETGEGLGVVLVFRDITSRKLAEEKLRRSQEHYHLLFDSIPHPVWVYDRNTLAILDVNRCAIRDYGYSREEFLSLTIKDIRPPEDVPALLNSLASASDTIGSSGSWTHIRKDGTFLDVEVTSHALTYDGAEARLVVATNITARKRAEEALRSSEQRLHLALEAAQLGIWELDLANDKAYRNLRHDQIFGYESMQPEWGQAVFFRHVLPEDQEAVKESFTKAFASGDLAMECRIVWKDNSVHCISARGRCFRDGNGAPVKMMGTVADITEHRRAQEAILQAKEEAERASKFKDRFLSTMSHELRTPLNAVLGFSELLRDERYGPLNERQQRYLTHIHMGGRHLLTLINDILDLSRIEAGHLQLAIESVPISTAFGEVVDSLRPLADKKSQVLVHQSSDLSVRADATRFKQALINLLGNAIKFTPEGGKIELAAQSVDQTVRVEVRDTGPGIPLEEQRRIFEAFYRLQHGSKAPEGTGLGLAITRRLIELHGGQLGLQSQPGAGSCFFFTLPAAPTFKGREGGPAQPANNARKSARILVIEDDSTSAQLIESQLASSGYQTLLCVEQRGAVEVAADLQPDAITLDIMMKPVNGWELLTDLKQNPRTTAIPVIVVSMVDQPATGALLGADEYVVKPVEKEALLAAVDRCLNRRGRSEHRREILVVDDDPSTRDFVGEVLSRCGYAVSTASDGARARVQVAASLPELVILDLMLPEVSGFQLLSEWRSDARTAHLPIVVLTGKELTAEEKDYLRMNAGALLHKHEGWQEALLAHLERVLVAVPAAKP